MSRRSISAIAAILLSGLAAVAVAATDDAEPTLPIAEFMTHVLKRNAEQLWAWTAIEVDERGEHSGQPVTDQDWEDAESDALTLRQLTLELEHSPAARDSRWKTHIVALRAAATASAKAAQTKNFPELVKTGEAINAACIACHMTFAPDLETRPPPVPLP